MHVLCPDPWPKAKHRANRLLSAEFLGRLSAKIKPGGYLHLATDNEAYWELMCQNISHVPVYAADDGAIDDVRDIKTDFERGYEEMGITVPHRAWKVRH